MEELVYDRKRKGDASRSRHVVVEWGKRSKKVKVTGELLASVLSACGSVSRAKVGEAGRCGFASFADEDEAARAVAELNGVSCERLRRRKLRIAFADLVDVAEREARYLPIECTSATAGVEVPGLELQEQWVSEEEEAELMSAVAAAPWDCHMKRRVQHYGFPFDYVTRSARTSEPLGPLPPWLARLRDRVAPLFPAGQPPDQFTVNEYAPGEGISQHVDTPEAFGPVLATLSLGSDTVMGLWCLGAVSHHKNLALPRRALLLFRGEARHWWTHGIARRRVDVVDGRTQRRGRRVSLTMRRVREPHAVGADVPSLPGPGGAETGSGPAGASSTPPNHARTQLTRLEKEHVHKVYEAIAPHFSSTRYAPWPGVRDFLRRQGPGSLIADVGCGNGKYMGVLGGASQVVGCDFSPALLAHARDRGHEVFSCDAQCVPLRSGAFDGCLCIAVLHHVATVARRVHVLAEMARLLRPGGRGLVYVWAMEQEGSSRRQFAAQDVLVPWSMAKRFSAGLRAQGAAEGTATPTPDSGSGSGGSSGACGQSAGQEAAGVEAAGSGSGAAAGDTGRGGASIRSVPLAEATAAGASPSSSPPAAPPSQEGGEEGGVVYHRFCHVYCEGEVEGLLARVPNTHVVDSYFDTSNWCIEFEKTA